VLDRYRGEIAAHGVDHTRGIAGFHAPDQAADNARRGDFRLEASDFAIVLAFDRIEREPGDGGGAAVRADIVRRLPESIRQGLTVVPASLGEDAPALGAARLASVAAA
jgi:hypothetical protein